MQTLRNEIYRLLHNTATPLERKSLDWDAIAKQVTESVKVEYKGLWVTLTFPQLDINGELFTRKITISSATFGQPTNETELIKCFYDSCSQYFSCGFNPV